MIDTRSKSKSNSKVRAANKRDDGTGLVDCGVVASCGLDGVFMLNTLQSTRSEHKAGTVDGGKEEV